VVVGALYVLFQMRRFLFGDGSVAQKLMHFCPLGIRDTSTKVPFHFKTGRRPSAETVAKPHLDPQRHVNSRDAITMSK